jgi:hypothetical protein
MHTPLPETLSFAKPVIYSFASHSFDRFCFSALMRTFIFMLMLDTCTATTLNSNILSRGSDSIPTVAVKHRNETAASNLSKMFQLFYFDRKKNQMRTDVATTDQSIHIKTDDVQNRMNVDTSQSLTDTVSVSPPHLNTRRLKSSSSRLSNVTHSVIRTLSWVSIIQSVDRLLKANDFDIATQVGVCIFYSNDVHI